MATTCDDDDDHQLMDGIRFLINNQSSSGFFNLSCKDIGDMFAISSAVGDNDVIDGPDDPNDVTDHRLVELLSFGADVYAYVTPFIIVIGILGNAVAMLVFLSRRMRKMSASLYLVCLAASDMSVLVTYVLVEWLDRGLQRWPWGQPCNLTAVRGLCETYMFTSYAFRFMSAWFIVSFTIERYMGICMPLRGQIRGKHAIAKRSLAAVVLVAVAASLWKPFLMAVQVMRGVPICSSRPEYLFVNFVLDSLYAGSITVVPFVIIVVLNFLICRKLRETKRRYISHRFVTEDSSIRLEFTAILLLVSTMFIVLNVPYFVAWFHRFLLQLSNVSLHPVNIMGTERSRGWMHVTKTIFFCNYCINPFIYSLTGAHFRGQLRRCVACCLQTAGTEHTAVFLSRNCNNSQTTNNQLCAKN